MLKEFDGIELPAVMFLNHLCDVEEMAPVLNYVQAFLNHLCDVEVTL